MDPIEILLFTNPFHKKKRPHDFKMGYRCEYIKGVKIRFYILTVQTREARMNHVRVLF